MSFVMIAAGIRRSDRVRTLSARRALALGSLAAATLLAAGAALGYWAAAAQAPTAPGAAGVEAPAHPFALEQIGALSARLFTLENQAAQLGERIGLPPPAVRTVAGPAPASAPSPAVQLPPAAPAAETISADHPPASGGRGGPLQPPRPMPGLDDLAGLDEQLAVLEARIDLVADAVALRRSDQMRLPSRRPVATANLVSAFGNRRDPFSARLAFHAGLDFAAAQGTPILSAGGGVVRAAGFRPDYGWTVEIDHGNGLRTRYAHASRLMVRRGAVVAPGERIALVGSTGRSTGPHLHFEVLRDGRQVDPRRYLAAR